MVQAALRLASSPGSLDSYNCELKVGVCAASCGLWLKKAFVARTEARALPRAGGVGPYLLPLGCSNMGFGLAHGALAMARRPYKGFYYTLKFPCEVCMQCFDATANPYLGLAALVTAGLEGIRQELKLPVPTAVDPGELLARAWQRLYPSTSSRG